MDEIALKVGAASSRVATCTTQTEWTSGLSDPPGETLWSILHKGSRPYVLFPMLNLCVAAGSGGADTER